MASNAEEQNASLELAGNSLSFSCGGTSLSIRQLFLVLQQKGGPLPQTAFITDVAYVECLLRLFNEAAALRNVPIKRFKWTQFNKNYEDAVIAHNARREDKTKNLQFLSPMPSADRFRRYHYAINKNQKPVKSNAAGPDSEIVPIEHLPDYFESWKVQDQKVDKDECECLRFRQHCIESTTFSKEFLDVFVQTCGTVESDSTRPSASKKARRSVAVAKRPNDAIEAASNIGIEVSNNTSHNTIEAKDSQVATYDNNVVLQNNYYSMQIPGSAFDSQSRYKHYVAETALNFGRANLPFPCMSYEEWIQSESLSPPFHDTGRSTSQAGETNENLTTPKTTKKTVPGSGMSGHSFGINSLAELSRLSVDPSLGSGDPRGILASGLSSLGSNSASTVRQSKLKGLPKSP